MNYQTYCKNILDKVRFLLNCSENCCHAEILIVMDADKPYAEIELKSHSMTV